MSYPSTDGQPYGVERDDVVAQTATLYSAGVPISAVVYRPREAIAALRPGVVIANGMRGVKEWIVPRFGELFAAAGYTAMTFDYRGMGASGGEPGRVIPMDQVEDVRSVVSYLAQLDDVDAERIVAWGTSLGGAHTTVAAALDDRIKAVATQVAFGDWGRVMRHTLTPEKLAALTAEFEADREQRAVTGVSGRTSPDRMLDNEESRAIKARSATQGERPDLTFTYESIERCFEYQPEQWAARIAPRPFLVIGSSVDVVVPFAECQSLYDHAGEPKQLVGMDIGHYAICEPPGADEAAAIAIEFLGPVAFPAG